MIYNTTLWHSPCEMSSICCTLSVLSHLPSLCSISLGSGHSFESGSEYRNSHRLPFVIDFSPFQPGVIRCLTCPFKMEDDTAQAPIAPDDQQVILKVSRVDTVINHHSYLLSLATHVARRKSGVSRKQRGACSAASLGRSATLLLSRRGELVEDQLGTSVQHRLLSSPADPLAINISASLKKDSRTWRAFFNTLSKAMAFRKLLRHRKSIHHSVF